MMITVLTAAVVIALAFTPAHSQHTNSLFHDDPFPSLFREDVVIRDFSDRKEVRDKPIVFPGFSGFRTFRRRRDAQQVDTGKTATALDNIASLIAKALKTQDTKVDDVTNQDNTFEIKSPQVPVVATSNSKHKTLTNPAPIFETKSSQSPVFETSLDSNHDTLTKVAPINVKSTLNKKIIKQDLDHIQDELVAQVEESPNTRNSRHSNRPVVLSISSLPKGKKLIIGRASAVKDVLGKSYHHHIDSAIKKAQHPIFKTQYKGANIPDSDAPKYTPVKKTKQPIFQTNYNGANVLEKKSHKYYAPGATRKVVKPELYKSEGAFKIKEYVPPNKKQVKSLYKVREEQRKKQQKSQAHKYVFDAITKLSQPTPLVSTLGTPVYVPPTAKYITKPKPVVYIPPVRKGDTNQKSLLESGVKTIGVAYPARGLTRVYSTDRRPDGLAGQFVDWRVVCNTKTSSKVRWITSIYDNNDHFNHIDKIRCSGTTEKIELDPHDNDIVDLSKGTCAPGYLLTGIRKMFDVVYKAHQGKCTKLKRGTVDTTRCDTYYTRGKHGGLFGRESKWNVQCPPRWAAVGLEEDGHHITSLLCCALKGEFVQEYSQLRLPGTRY